MLRESGASSNRRRHGDAHAVQDNECRRILDHPPSRMMTESADDDSKVSGREPLRPALADFCELRGKPYGVVLEHDLLMLRPRRRLAQTRLRHQCARAWIGRT